jgi:hypothetical protein
MNRDAEAHVICFSPSTHPVTEMFLPSAKGIRATGRQHVPRPEREYLGLLSGFAYEGVVAVNTGMSGYGWGL